MFRLNSFLRDAQSGLSDDGIKTLPSLHWMQTNGGTQGAAVIICWKFVCSNGERLSRLWTDGERRKPK